MFPKCIELGSFLQSWLMALSFFPLFLVIVIVTYIFLSPPPFFFKVCSLTAPFALAVLSCEVWNPTCVELWVSVSRVHVRVTIHVLDSCILLSLVSEVLQTNCSWVHISNFVYDCTTYNRMLVGKKTEKRKKKKVDLFY